MQNANGQVRLASEDESTLVHRMLKNRTEIIEPTPRRRTFFSEVPSPATPDESIGPTITVNDDPNIAGQNGGAWNERTQEKWTTSVKKLQVIRKWKNRKVAQRIDRYSRICFPTTFIVFNIVYWIYYVYFA